MATLSKEEVDRLLNSLISEYLPPVTEMKPSEIEKLSEFERHNYRIQFQNVLQIYVKPLEKLVESLLNSANREKYSYNVDNLSILDRVTLYSNILKRSGFSEDQLTSLVPRTVEEVDLLAKAINKGFDDSNILDNEIRINEAREFLQNLEEGISQGRRVA